MGGRGAEEEGFIEVTQRTGKEKKKKMRTCDGGGGKEGVKKKEKRPSVSHCDLHQLGPPHKTSARNTRCSQAPHVGRTKSHDALNSHIHTEEVFLHVMRARTRIHTRVTVQDYKS